MGAKLCGMDWKGFLGTLLLLLLLDVLAIMTWVGQRFSSLSRLQRPRTLFDNSYHSIMKRANKQYRIPRKIPCCSVPSVGHMSAAAIIHKSSHHADKNNITLRMASQMPTSFHWMRLFPQPSRKHKVLLLRAIFNPANSSPHIPSYPRPPVSRNVQACTP